ncbi:hypothetical protein C8Q73DRAFT_524500 [Cubamyces lactineus]|nr:hypothetical protein C8Q73DRAFT_524500 [Cubamyces lactineus]
MHNGRGGVRTNASTVTICGPDSGSKCTHPHLLAVTGAATVTSLCLLSRRPERADASRAAKSIRAPARRILACGLGEAAGPKWTRRTRENTPEPGRPGPIGLRVDTTSAGYPSMRSAGVCLPQVAACKGGMGRLRYRGSLLAQLAARACPGRLSRPQ